MEASEVKFLFDMLKRRYSLKELEVSIRAINRRIDTNPRRIDTAMKAEKWIKVSETRSAFIERTLKQNDMLETKIALYKRLYEYLKEGVD